VFSLLPWRYVGVLSISRTQVKEVTSPQNWVSVKIALVKSIRKGVLFDRKYWVRHLRTGDALRPVYLSSIAMGDRLQRLNTRALKFDYVR